MDTDNNGSIDFNELKMGAVNYGVFKRAQDVKELYHAMDVDGNGTIEYSKFLAATYSDYDDMVIQNAFSYFDQQGKGYISIKDFENGFRRMGRFIKQRHLKQMIIDSGLSAQEINFI